MTRPTLVILSAVAALLATRHDARSQAPQLRVAAGGGIATDARGVTSRAVTVAPALTWRVDSRLSLGAGATGTRFADQQWSLGGSGRASARLPLGSFAALTMDAAAAATTTSYDASYQTVDAVPALELRAGPLTAFGGAHAASARSSLVAPTATPLGVVPGGATTTSATRSAVGPLFGATVHAAVPGEMLVLGYREEHLAVAHVPYADRVASASVSNGRLTFAGSIGARAAHDEHTTFGTGSMSVALPRGIALELGGGTYPSNRLTGLPGGRYLSAGFSFGIGPAPEPGPGAGGASAGAAPPVARGIAPPPPGDTRLTIRAENATRVEVAGDFDGWTLVPAHRAPNGVWYVDRAIAPGRYRYAFRIDGTTWRVPDGAAAVDDPFGGKSAWLVVHGHDAADAHDTKEDR